MMPRHGCHAKAVGDGVMPGSHVTAACVSRTTEHQASIQLERDRQDSRITGEEYGMEQRPKLY